MSKANISKKDIILLNSEFSTDQVVEDFIVARYFSFSKLKNLFEKKCFFIPNINKMTDKNERKIPEGFFKRFPNPESIENYKELNKILDKVYQSYISCWTKYDTENFALWKIYCPENDGICVVTKISKLREYFKHNMFACFEVEYIDFNKSGEKLPWILTENDYNIRGKEKFKISPYKYEEEIRFVAYSKKKSNGIKIYFDDYSWIDKIIISPFANSEIRSEITTFLGKYIDANIIADSLIEEELKNK